MELGIGETLLMKALANSTGRSLQQIKADVVKTGDLGVVAETSKGSQRTMFQVCAWDAFYRFLEQFTLTWRNSL
jgi:hypothetical protein